MVEQPERRQDQKDFMIVLRAQNLLLAEQNETLAKICAFIDPVAEFFKALKSFVVFMAWIIGTIAACYAAWQGFVAWVKTH